MQVALQEAAGERLRYEPGHDPAGPERLVLSEDGAMVPEVGGEWNARQNLAHLIAAERDLHTWISSMAEGQEVADIFHGSTTRLEAISAAFPVYSELLAEYRRSQIVTIMLVQRLPSVLEKRKGSFWRLAYQLLTLVEHTRDHIEQIRQGLQAAQEAFQQPAEAVEVEPAASPAEDQPPAKRQRSKKGKPRQEG